MSLSSPRAQSTQPQHTSKPRLRTAWIATLGLLLLVGLSSSCIERLSTSAGMTCDKGADCWDQLPCVKDVCTGPEPPPEAKPEPEPTKAEPAPEPTKAEPSPDEASSPSDAGDAGDAGTPEPNTSENPAEQSTPEPAPEPGPEPQPEPGPEPGPCKGNLNANGFCSVDGDCCTGQTCTAVPIPNAPPDLKLCGTCKSNDDCPQGTICCTQFSLCAIQCSSP